MKQKNFKMKSKFSNKTMTDTLHLKQFMRQLIMKLLIKFLNILMELLKKIKNKEPKGSFLNFNNKKYRNFLYFFVFYSIISSFDFISSGSLSAHRKLFFKFSSFISLTVVLLFKFVVNLIYNKSRRKPLTLVKEMNSSFKNCIDISILL